MSSLLKNLIIALGITVALGVVYMFTIGKSDDGLDTGMEDVSSSEIRMQNEKILANTREIDEYTMDVSILSDVRFTSLTNYHVNIEDVDTGRSNPFAPLE